MTTPTPTKSAHALRRLIARHGGRRYELIAVDFAGGATQYETYRVHRDARLSVTDGEGSQVTVAFFGSVLERGGEFKLFSYVVD